MKYVIITPGGTVQYDVPIMKVQTYSIDDIFQKRLLMLIPFYTFSHEKHFSEYNQNKQKLEKIKAEYQDILKRLEELEQQEVLGSFDKQTIIELSRDVIQEISQKYEKVQKGIGSIMRGALIETETKKILMQGIKQGMKQGRDEGIKQGKSETERELVIRMLKKGKLTVEEIAEYSKLSIEEIEQLAKL